MKPSKLENKVMAKCLDCGKLILHKDFFIVRKEVWQAAGLTYSGGYLHASCLEARLRRPLTDADYLIKYVSGGRKRIQFECLDVPAYREFVKEFNS